MPDNNHPTPEPQHQNGEKPVTSPLGARRVAPFIASGNSETLTRFENKGSK